MFGFVVANVSGRLAFGIDGPGRLDSASSEENEYQSSFVFAGHWDVRGFAGAGGCFVLLTGATGRDKGRSGLEQRSTTSGILTGGTSA